MQTYFKTRGRLWSVAVTAGGLFSTVLFRMYVDGIRNYFRVGIFGRHEFVVLLIVYLLPIPTTYIVLYVVNRLLIWYYGAEELQDRKRKLLVSLVDAHIFGHKMFYGPDDLLDEYAWSALKPLWRRK